MRIAEPVTVLKPQQFGAKGDAIQRADGVMAKGGAVLTSRGATFAAGDVGKSIRVLGAGRPNAAPYLTSSRTVVLVTMIAKVNSPTSIMLADPAFAAVKGALYQYGTDDTRAIQAALERLRLAGGGTLDFGVGGYFVSVLPSLSHPSPPPGFNTLSGTSDQNNLIFHVPRGSAITGAGMERCHIYCSFPWTGIDFPSAKLGVCYFVYDDGFTASNISFWGDYPPANFTAGQPSAANDFCGFRPWWQGNAMLQQAFNKTIEGPLIHHCRFANIPGFYVGSGAAKKARFTQNLVSRCGNGYNIGGTDIEFELNRVEWSEGAEIAGDSFDTGEPGYVKGRIKVDNNSFFNVITAASLGGYFEAAVHDRLLSSGYSFRGNVVHNPDVESTALLAVAENATDVLIDSAFTGRAAVAINLGTSAPEIWFNAAGVPWPGGFLAFPHIPATQAHTLDPGRYRLYVTGSGSVALSGGATGTAAPGRPASFRLGGKAQVTFTVRGAISWMECNRDEGPMWGPPRSQSTGSPRDIRIRGRIDIAAVGVIPIGVYDRRSAGTLDIQADIKTGASGYCIVPAGRGRFVNGRYERPLLNISNSRLSGHFGIAPGGGQDGFNNIVVRYDRGSITWRPLAPAGQGALAAPSSTHPGTLIPL